MCLLEETMNAVMPVASLLAVGSESTSTLNGDTHSGGGIDFINNNPYSRPIPNILVADCLKEDLVPPARSESPPVYYFFGDAFIFPGPTEVDPKAPFVPRKFDTPEEEEEWWNDPKQWPMDHLLKPYTNEMWTALEEMNSSSGSSGCSTCLSPSPLEAETEAELEAEAEPTGLSTQQHHYSSPRSPRRVGSEGPVVAPTPTTPKQYPEFDPRLLDPLQTLATIATWSPDSLQRLTTQNQSQNLNSDNNEKAKGSLEQGRKEDDDMEEDDDDDDYDSESPSSSSRSPHHTRSPRSYTNYQAHRDAKRPPLQKGQREAMPRTSRATHQNHHRQVVPPTRTLRRRPSPSPRPRPRALSQSQSQSQALSQSSSSQSISGASGSKLLYGNQQDIIIRYPQAKGSRRPALDISSERLLTSLRDQLKEGVFPQYTMPHPQRDGNMSAKKWRCTYDLEDGGRCNASCSRMGEARRHAFTHEIHLRWICPSLSSKASSCGKLFARQDAAVRHVEQSKSCKDFAANRTEGFPVLVWEEEDEIVAKIVTLSWKACGYE